MTIEWNSFMLGMIVGHAFGVASLAIWAGMRKMNDDLRGRNEKNERPL